MLLITPTEKLQEISLPPRPARSGGPTVIPLPAASGAAPRPLTPEPRSRRVETLRAAPSPPGRQGGPGRHGAARLGEHGAGLSPERRCSPLHSGGRAAAERRGRVAVAWGRSPDSVIYLFILETWIFLFFFFSLQLITLGSVCPGCSGVPGDKGPGGVFSEGESLALGGEGGREGAGLRSRGAACGARPPVVASGSSGGWAGERWAPPPLPPRAVHSRVCG